MFLPPGPMILPIFSGSILIGEQARGPLADFLARAGKGRGHLVENDQPGFFRAVQRIANDLVSRCLRS